MNKLKKKQWARLCQQLKKLSIMNLLDLRRKNLEKIRILPYNKSVVRNQNKNRIETQIMAWYTYNKNVVRKYITSFILFKKYRLCKGQP